MCCKVPDVWNFECKHKSIGFNDLVIGIILTTILLKERLSVTMQNKNQNVIENSSRDRSCESSCAGRGRGR